MTIHIPVQNVSFIVMCRFHFIQAFLAPFKFLNLILEDMEQYVIYLSVNNTAFFISLVPPQQYILDHY